MTSKSADQKALELVFQRLVAKHLMPAFAQARTGHRVTEMLRTMLLMHGVRKTISNTIVARGIDQEDWRADYRAFSEGKWDPVDLFHGVFRACLPWLPKEGPIVLALDDTALPKVGKKIAHVRWVHNPLCPVWVKPAIQLGIPMFHGVLLLPRGEVHRPSAITIAFEPIKDTEWSAKMRRRKALAVPDDAQPTPKKRGRPTKEEAARRKAEFGVDPDSIGQVKDSASRIAVRTIQRVREWMDDNKMQDRQLLVVADGSYTNGTVIGHLPDRVDYIGRTREKSNLCAVGEKIHGGAAQYGERLPTPVELAKDRSVPSYTGRFDYGGQERTLSFKVVSPVYRRHSTRKVPLKLMILAPVPYGHGTTRGYNKRAYLLTTSFHLSEEVLVQAYLDRWQIEVLHRDLKSGVGMGQAQVRTERSVDRIHSALAAAYALLLLAVRQTQGQERTDRGFGRLPKWRTNVRSWRARKAIAAGKQVPTYRPSVTDMTALLRQALADVRSHRLVA